MNPIANRPINSSLPIQQVSYEVKFLKEKDKNGVTKWMKDTMDALEALGRYGFYNNIELRKNYEIMSGRFNVEDYADVFETYDISTTIYQELKLPSFLKHYDITTKAVRLLLGEYIKRPDVIRVVDKSPDTTNEKLRIKKDLVNEYIQGSIQQEITNKLISIGLDPNRDKFSNDQEAQEYQQQIQQKYQEFTPESIERYLTYDYKSKAEHWGQATLSEDLERFRIKEQDQIEFYDMLVADRAFSHIYLTPTGYSLETWNPLSVFHQFNAHNRNVEDLAFVGRILYLSKTEIIDIFGWRMTVEQIESLYPDFQRGEGKGDVFREAFNATMYPWNDYRQYDTLVSALGVSFAETSIGASPYGIPQFGFSPGTDGTNYIFTQSDIVQVTQAYWKSQRRIGMLTLEDGSVEVVDETFDPKLFGLKEVKTSFKDSGEPNSVVWTWITESWQGVKINVNYNKDQSPEDRTAIYIDIRPCEFQFRGNDVREMWNCKLPVVGQVFNNRNGRSQSLVDLLKPYQVMVNAFYNQAYQIGQKNNGKFALLGASLLPSVKDWGGEESSEKFMTIANNLGFMVVDDTPNNPGGVQSLQYSGKVVDLDESDRIQRLINLCMLIEQQGFMQIGITPQRQGSITSSETATGTQTAVNNSYAVTEIYFEQFSNYRRRKLQMLLEMSQYVQSDGEGDITLDWTTSDLGRSFIQVNKADILLKTLGVYLMNSAEIQRKKQIIEELILKNNQTLMPFSKLMDIIRLESLADIQRRIEEQEKKQQEQQQAQQEQAMQLEKEKLDREDANKEADRQNKLQVAQIQAQNRLDAVTLQGIANEGSFSQEVDTTDKLIAQRELALKESQIATQNAMQQSLATQKILEGYRKEKMEDKKLKSTEKLKKDEASWKREIEKEKNEGIDKQSRNQELMQKRKIEADEKLAKLKGELEKQKKDKELEVLDKKIEIIKAEVEANKKKLVEEVKQVKTKTDTENQLGKVKIDVQKKLGDISVNEKKQLSEAKIEQKKKEIKIKPKINPKK